MATSITDSARKTGQRKRFDLKMDPSVWEELNVIKDITYAPTDAEVMRKAIMLLLKIAPILSNPNEKLAVIDRNGNVKRELDIL